MTEEFLHHIWKFRLFDNVPLFTTEGKVIEILKPGEHNTDAGPDFFNARLKIGNTLWAGNVEIHINSSDWQKHKHQNDKAYDNIILHVVYNEDKKEYRKSGEVIPTLVLKDLINKDSYQTYLNFKSNKDWIPCQRLIVNVPAITINSTIDRLLLERLEYKATSIVNSLKLNKNNWEETFYQHIARNFGFATNAQPFELLAKSLPSFILAKHKNSLLQLEALLYGQAGILNKKFEEDYPQVLQREYTFLKHKYKLQSVDEHLWKFLRLRPFNFPTIRIAQFAGLLFRASHLFSKIIETESLNKLKTILNTDVSEYWLSHYIFDKSTKIKTKTLGSSSVDSIIINTIVPFLFVYGKQKGDEKLVERSLSFLEQIQGENNSIIKNWKVLKMPVKNAYSTQALLQLKNEYCKNKKCLNCNIGNYLIKKV